MFKEMGTKNNKRVKIKRFSVDVIVLSQCVEKCTADVINLENGVQLNAIA
jgi:hypothetical protein